MKAEEYKRYLRSEDKSNDSLKVSRSRWSRWLKCKVRHKAGLLVSKDEAIDEDDPRVRPNSVGERVCYALNERSRTEQCKTSLCCAVCESLESLTWTWWIRLHNVKIDWQMLPTIFSTTTTIEQVQSSLNLVVEFVWKMESKCLWFFDCCINVDKRSSSGDVISEWSNENTLCI